ncbi:MAG: DUF3256 family protein, partial [Duncaniella sp.]|nr:DUF3256 family protein [Duncaniella sp.]
MKKYLLSLTVALGSLAALAQTTAADLFTSAPQSVFPLLDRNTRLDMVDYYKNGMATQSQNQLDGRSAITEMTPESVTVKMSDSSASQLVELKGSDGPVIALINTVATPGLDSNIKFFDANWNPLPPANFFTQPGWKEWLTESGRQHEADVTMQAPFMLSSYRIDHSTSTLTLTNNLGGFLDKEIYDDVSSYLNPTLTYTWTGKGFKLAK